MGGVNQTFQTYLQSELLRRCRANPKYSLRAFARTLAVEPSYLSKLLNGKRPITESTLRRLASRLEIGSEDLARYQSTLSRKSGITLAAAPFVQLDPERFRMISEWHHYAILELLRLPGFKLSARSVSKMLGLTLVEAKDAVDRLRQLGMLPDSKKGETTPKNHTTLGSADTAIAFRAFQKQVLQMAIAALEDIPIEERDQSSMTMAMNRKFLPEARQRIRDFRRALDHDAQAAGEPDSVYHLSISLYPVTKTKKGPSL